MSMSSAWSATIFFRRWFSCSSSFSSLGVVGLHAAVLVAPAVPGRLGDLEVPGHLLDGLALAEELLALGQLADDLLGRVSRLFMLCCPPSPILGIGLAQRVDQFTGTRSTRELHR